MRATRTYEKLLWGGIIIRTVCHPPIISLRVRQENVLGTTNLGTPTFVLLERLTLLHFLERGTDYSGVVEEDLSAVASDETETAFGD